MKELYEDYLNFEKRQITLDGNTQGFLSKQSIAGFDAEAYL